MRSLGSGAAALLFAVFSLWGCTALRGDTHLESEAQEPGVQFAGLLLGREAQPAAARRYVFNIHGMGRTPEGYNEKLGDWLVDLAGYRRLDDRSAQWVKVSLPTVYTVSGEGLGCTPGREQDPCRFATFGRYRVEHFRRRIGDRDDDVFVYTYFWEDDLWRVQEPYLREDLGRKGAVINTALKHRVIDEGLGDAAGYIGELGVLLREGTRGAVCEMLRDAAGQAGVAAAGARTAGPAGSACLADLGARGFTLGDDVEFSFISHSLGSRILLDSLAPYTDESGAAHADASAQNLAKRALALRTRTFFMAANQAPLLGIGRVSVRPGVAMGRADQPCAPRTFLDNRCPPLGPGARSDEPALLRLDVVALFDPDDLLGYRPDGALLGAPDAQNDDPLRRLRFVTVSHRNTPQWLGLFANPMQAHDHELQRRSAMRLIFCGGESKGGRQLSPRRCVK